MELARSASLEEVLDYLDRVPAAVILFVDQTKACVDFSNFPWVQTETEVVEVDQEILDHFQIGKVPQFRFYVRAQEVAHLIGTANNEEFTGLKNKMFKNVRSLRR